MTAIIRASEKAIADRLRASSALTGINIYEGHSDEDRELPCAMVVGEAATERDDIPPGSAIYDVRLLVGVMVQADDTNLSSHDSTLAEIVSRILETEERDAAIEAAAGVHFYAIHLGEQKSSREDRKWINSIELNAVAQSV